MLLYGDIRNCFRIDRDTYLTEETSERLFNYLNRYNEWTFAEIQLLLWNCYKITVDDDFDLPLGKDKNGITHFTIIKEKN